MASTSECGCAAAPSGLDTRSTADTKRRGTIGVRLLMAASGERERTRTRTEADIRTSEHVSHCDPQVAKRRVLLGHEVTAFADAAAGHDKRQRIGTVHVRVAHAAAVEHHRVIEQRAVAIRRRRELLQKL